MPRPARLHLRRRRRVRVIEGDEDLDVQIDFRLEACGETPGHATGMALDECISFVDYAIDEWHCAARVSRASTCG